MIYLRSDGHGEYKAIIGRIGILFYHLMFNFLSLFSNFISCRNYILRGKKENCSPFTVGLCLAQKTKR